MSARYTLPQFILPLNIWNGNNDVQANAPDVVTAGNLVLSRPDADPLPQIVAINPAPLFLAAQRLSRFVTILMPKLTDVRSGVIGECGSAIECPAGSGRFYYAVFVDDVGKGFPNEHRMAYCLQCTDEIVKIFLNWQNPPTWPWPLP